MLVNVKDSYRERERVAKNKTKHKQNQLQGSGKRAVTVARAQRTPVDGIFVRTMLVEISLSQIIIIILLIYHLTIYRKKYIDRYIDTLMPKERRMNNNNKDIQIISVVRKLEIL